MATKKAKTKDSGAGTVADSNVVIPRMSLGEQGFIGLRTSSGLITEEANRHFRYPYFIQTINEMKANGTIAAALAVYRMLMMQAPWKVKPPKDADAKDIERAEFVESCMGDMEDTWSQVMAETITYLEYGYAVQEKVFRRRLTRNGSKYNDGLVGLKKIATRSQDTIRRWNFSEDGRTLESISQSLTNMEYGARYQNLANAEDGMIRIDREKFMLFSADSVKSNPEGKSILKNVYLPYKQLTMLKDQLLTGVAKDLSSIPIVKLPPQFMDVNASPEDKAAYQAYQKLVDNVAAGTQRGVIIPQMVDPETKVPMFDFSLLEAKGTNKFDLPGIIEKYQKEILDALQIDTLGMDASTNSNFNLRNSLTYNAVKHRLNEIREVLNKDLIPQLYALNGWSQEKLPTFEFGDFVDIDVEGLSKAVQRAASVGAVEVDREFLNRMRKMLGIEPLADDAEVDREILSGAESRAGDGMKPGTTGNGTAKQGGKHKKNDSSADNADNTA